MAIFRDRFDEIFVQFMATGLNLAPFLLMHNFSSFWEKLGEVKLSEIVLFPETKHHQFKELFSNPVFQNNCGKSQRKCENNSTCQSGFTQKGYRCSCTTGFEGEYCDKGNYVTRNITLCCKLSFSANFVQLNIKASQHKNTENHIFLRIVHQKSLFDEILVMSSDRFSIFTDKPALKKRERRQLDWFLKSKSNSNSRFYHL